MEIPRSLPERLTEELNALSESGRKMVRNALDRVEWSDVSELRRVMAEVMEAVCSELSELAAARSAEFYDDVREVAVGSRLGAVVDPGRSREATEGAVRALVQSVVDTGSTDRFARDLGDGVDYEVKKSAGDCIVANASRDPLRPRYARVPSGSETCPFCVMLASRGFVYESKRSAGSVDHYHPNCDCRVVPGFDGMAVDGYDPDELYWEWRRGGLRNRLSLRKDADPARSHFGPAARDDLDAVFERIDRLGIDVVRSSDGLSMGYSPGEKGSPGRISMPEGASLSAWLHEVDHAEFDAENGYPGVLYYLLHPEKKIEMERRAYDVEIEIALRSGYNDLAEELEKLKEAEIERIEQFYNL